MTPQAPAAPKDDEKAAEKAAAEAAEREWNELVAKATAGDSAGGRQIERAMQLERDRASLLKRIDDNRKYLRLMDRNEELTTEQTEWLDRFYPEKEKGERRSKEEVEATRRAREAARKVN